MEIQSLKLLLTGDDLNALATRFLPADAPVKHLLLAIHDRSLQMSGSYPGPLFNIPFSVTWEPSIQGGHVRLHLSATRVIGLPVGFLNGVLLGVLRKAAAAVQGVRVEEESLLFDIDRLLADRGIPLTTNLKLVRCEPGRMTIEA